MKHRITSAVSPLVAFRLYDALDVLPELATEGATDLPNCGRRPSLPTRQRRALLDDQPRPLVVAAPPWSAPPRQRSPARMLRRARYRNVARVFRSLASPNRPRWATLDLAYTTALRVTRPAGPNVAASRHLVVSAAGGALAPREITMALAGIALEVVDPPG